jgi:hypothetical protein
MDQALPGMLGNSIRNEGRLMSRNTWPIIIGGCHRSGTSLIRRVLNAHSRINCGPEVKFFRDFYGDYSNDPLRHLRFTSSARAILPEDELLELLGGTFVDSSGKAAVGRQESRECPVFGTMATTTRR